MKMKITILLMIILATCGCARKEADMDYGAMVLDICGAKKIKNPTDEQIQAELASLSTKNEDSFAILGPSDMTFIQVSGDKSVGFVVEYQDGSVGTHFKAIDKKIYLDQVVRAFVAYRAGRPDWKAGFKFEKITL